MSQIQNMELPGSMSVNISESRLGTQRFHAAPLGHGAMLQSRWFSKGPLGYKLEIILVKICKDMTSISSQP